jgi:hypothetical protein
MVAWGWHHAAAAFRLAADLQLMHQQLSPHGRRHMQHGVGSCCCTATGAACPQTTLGTACDTSSSTGRNKHDT